MGFRKRMRPAGWKVTILTFACPWRSSPGSAKNAALPKPHSVSGHETGATFWSCVDETHPAHDDPWAGTYVYRTPSGDPHGVRRCSTARPRTVSRGNITRRPATKHRERRHPAFNRAVPLRHKQDRLRLCVRLAGCRCQPLRASSIRPYCAKVSGKFRVSAAPTTQAR